MPNTSDSENFELGLVFAGAISAGAYTAGVVDFLIEALEEWQMAKDNWQEGDDSIPRHTVQIRAISGASAGAMTAAMALRAFCSNIVHVPDTTSPPDAPIQDPAQFQGVQKNPLYASWVQSIDISHLLETTDIKSSESSAISVLDSSVLTSIGVNALRADGVKRNKRPAYISSALDIFLTNSNLTGVPYSFDFQNSPGRAPYLMSMHADYRHFQLSWDEAPLPQGSNDGPEPHILRANNLSPHGNWEPLINAALASGAFPVGLAPRNLNRPKSSYDNRTFTSSHMSGQVTSNTVKPSWPPDQGDLYEYQAVDGGMMNNEPFELVRTTLSKGGRNERDPLETKKAVLLIDPFPSEPDKKDDKSKKAGTHGDLLGTIQGIFSALLKQARFKPDEIALARNPNVASRYMIMPTVSIRRSDAGEIALASHCLGGFGGFLHESFRRHDFQRGRYNAQSFLLKHFVLPAGNPTFGGSKESPPLDLLENYGVPDPQGNSGELTHLPIVPLFGSALTTPKAIDCPKLTEHHLGVLSNQIMGRLQKFLPALGNSVIDKKKRKTRKFLRWALARKLVRKPVTEKLIKAIRKDLCKETVFTKD